VFTDDEGRYELREVPPGLYELKVSKDGYSTASTPPSQGLRLGLGQIARVDDITLKVAPAELRLSSEHHGSCDDGF